MVHVPDSEGLKRCGRARGFEFQVYGCRGLRSPADFVPWTALIFIPPSISIAATVTTTAATSTTTNQG